MTENVPYGMNHHNMAKNPDQKPSENKAETSTADEKGTFPNPWKPGQSGNPAGPTPKRGDVRGQIRFLLQQPELPEVTFSVGQKLALKMIKKSIESEDQRDTTLMIDQAFGTPKQSVTIDGGLDITSLSPEQVLDRLAQIRAERKALEEGGA